MSLVACNGGDLLLLKYLLNNTAATDQEYHLYSNDWTPGQFDLLSNYTETSTATGYSAFRTVGTNWTCTTSSSSGATASYSTINYNFVTAATAYGYYCTSPAQQQLLYAERFAGGPFTLPAAGGTIALSPKVSLS